MKPRILTSCLVALFAASGADASPVAIERALAVNLGGSDRDAFVFRAADGDGMGIFAPTIDGGYALKLFPGLGPEVDEIIEADLDGDGKLDLIARRRDGSLAPWLGDGNGGLRPEAVLIPASHPGAHHVVEPSSTELEAKRVQDAAHEALRARLAEGELPTTRFASTGITGSVSLTDLGPLPSGFRARLVASGRFGPGGAPAVAVLSEGARPRLAMIATRPDGEFVAREQFSPSATFNVSVGSGGFLFAPSSVNIQPGDTVHWTWAGSFHTVTSGTACVVDNAFCSPSNTNCLTASTSNSGATYDRVFPAAGTFPYFCRPHCDFGMTGTVIVQAPLASPGSVPDGATVPGVPLKLGKGAGGTLNLTWTSSCAGSATNYAVYEGTLPLTGSYDHAALNCALGNTTSANITPGAGSRYYLLVPETTANDGSYGFDRIGGVAHQLPAAASACHPQLLASCP